MSIKIKEKEQLIIHIPNELFEACALKNFKGAYYLSCIVGNIDTYKFEQPVDYDITVTNTGDAFYVSGSATAKATTSCARCLEDVTLHINCKVESYFIIDPSKKDEDKDSLAEFIILDKSHDIDLGKLICASLLTDAPNKPLCSEDCRGLCANCGANLNTEKCKCKDQVDQSNPFAVLADLKIEEK